MYGIEIAVEKSKDYTKGYLDEIYGKIGTQSEKISEGRQKYVNQMEETELLQLKMRVSYKFNEIFLAEIVPRVSMWSSDVTILLQDKIIMDHFPQFPPIMLDDEKPDRTASGEAGSLSRRTGRLPAALPVILLIVGAVLFLLPVLPFGKALGAVVFLAGLGGVAYQKRNHPRRPPSSQGLSAEEEDPDSDLKEILNQRKQLVYGGLCRWIDELAVEVGSGIKG